MKKQRPEFKIIQFFMMAVSQKLTDKLILELLNIIKCRDELENSTRVINHHVQKILLECLENCSNHNKHFTGNSNLKIDSIIDYLDDEMNIGHWSDISIDLRRVFTLASFIIALFHLKLHKSNIDVQVLRKTLKYIDKGILLGAPLEINSQLLTRTATILTNHIQKYYNQNDSVMNLNLKKKNNSMHYECLFQNIKAREIDVSVIPSLEQFNCLYFMTQQPVKLQGCIDHWPAMKKWKDLQYLLQVSGDRTVPVEIGTQYVDENWYQSLMTVREFIDKYYSNSNKVDVGYLAQHNLLDQIPELREDICIPEYCSLSKDYDESCDPDINCWFGPEGTVSSLHYDPKNNLLVQIYGTKQLLLFSPHDTQYLYPFEGSMLHNTSQVDPLIPNLELYPDFSKSTMYKCLLNEGEMLFIPEKWWHHVIALEKSFSVSFWWQ